MHCSDRWHHSVNWEKAEKKDGKEEGGRGNQMWEEKSRGGSRGRRVGRGEIRRKEENIEINRQKVSVHVWCCNIHQGRRLSVSCTTLVRGPVNKTKSCLCLLIRITSLPVMVCLLMVLPRTSGTVFCWRHLWFDSYCLALSAYPSHVSREFLGSRRSPGPAEAGWVQTAPSGRTLTPPLYHTKKKRGHRANVDVTLRVCCHWFTFGNGLPSTSCLKSCQPSYLPLLLNTNLVRGGRMALTTFKR